MCNVPQYGTSKSCVKFQGRFSTSSITNTARWNPSNLVVQKLQYMHKIMHPKTICLFRWLHFPHSEVSVSWQVRYLWATRKSKVPESYHNLFAIQRRPSEERYNKHFHSSNQISAVTLSLLNARTKLSMEYHSSAINLKKMCIYMPNDSKIGID